MEAKSTAKLSSTSSWVLPRAPFFSLFGPGPRTTQLKLVGRWIAFEVCVVAFFVDRILVHASPPQSVGWTLTPTSPTPPTRRRITWNCY